MKYYKLAGLPLALGVIIFLAVYLIVNPSDKAHPSPVAVATEEVTETTHKIGRLFIIGHWAKTPVASTTALLVKHQLGGVIIMSAPEDPDQVRLWTEEWKAAVDYPLMIAIDQEGGVVQRLRGADFISTAQREISTKEEAFAVAKQRGEELAALGINTNFAPVMESSVHPNGFLHDRTFTDPEEITLLGRSMLNGYQASGVIGVIKHYPGHDDVPTDSHEELPVIELKNKTFSEHTANFAELISIHNLTGGDLVNAIMTAHVLVPSIDPEYPATVSKKILTEELREKQKYNGVIITDDMTMDAIDEQFSTSEASLLALKAGADLILFAAEPTKVDEVIPNITKAIERGQLSPETIDSHFNRVIKLLEH